MFARAELFDMHSCMNPSFLDLFFKPFSYCQYYRPF